MKPAQVTLKTIATRARVDVSTVSKVLNGAAIRVAPEKRAEIERTARELGYRPNPMARALKQGRSGALAIVVPSTTNFVYPEIIRGAEQAAVERDYVLFILKASSLYAADQVARLVTQGRVDGLLFADDLPDLDVRRDLIEPNLPFVTLNRVDPAFGHYVALNDEEGFARQADYLAGLGHRKIAFVATSPLSYTANLCRMAFRKALAKRWVPMHDSLMLSCDFEAGEVARLTDELLSMSTTPTAVACASVLVAQRLVLALTDRGVGVPDQISVIGYHDSPVAEWPPPGITTVRMPSCEQGKRAVNWLIDWVEGVRPESVLLDVPPEIVERGTCRSPATQPGRSR